MQDTPTTLDRLKPLIADQFGVSADVLTPAWRLSDDGHSDALDAVELQMAVEDEFRIALDETDCDGCPTIADWVTLIDRTLKPL